MTSRWTRPKLDQQPQVSSQENLEIFKSYLTVMENDVDRRMKMNSYYFTLSASLTVAISFLITNKKAILDNAPENLYIAFMIGFSLIELSINISWISYLRSHIRLQKAQIEVMKEIEKGLSFTPITLETKKYRQYVGPYTRTFSERLIPLSFLCFGAALLCYSVFLILR